MTSDPRLTPPPGTPTVYQVTAGVVAIRESAEPDAQMVTQALHGETVEIYAEYGAFGRVRLPRDGYVGWALMDALSMPVLAATHKVSALRTYVYSEPDLKSAPHYMICLGAQVVGGRVEGDFIKCDRAGWVHARHLTALDDMSDDPAAIAELYIHTPYLWGGRESLGLDCTGLTQQAFEACGHQLPRDSDMQFKCGEAIADWQTPGALRRNDMVFWKGHVGLMLDSDTMIHANAYHMAVAAEPLAGAIERIEQYYAAPIGARRLLNN